MGKRWSIYLTGLLACLIFYIAYRGWVAWLLLLCALGLPALSLLLSLPGMLTSRVQIEMPLTVRAGQTLQLQVVIRSPLPTPPWQVAVNVYHTITGELLLLDSGSFCPTQHCGALNCKVQYARVYDYLGLFRIPLRRPANFRIFVRPIPLEPPVEPDLTQVLVTAWRPKTGGGFAENHELRLYRPGDSLHQIHWKLTAKTGKLILREPMVPDNNRMLLWMTLQGDPDTIDRKLGRLLWFSGYLQRFDLAHDILVYTAAGKFMWHISGQQTLRRAMDTLLCHSPYTDPHKPVLTEQVNWQHYIGGEEDEQEH